MKLTINGLLSFVAYLSYVPTSLAKLSLTLLNFGRKPLTECLLIAEN